MVQQAPDFYLVSSEGYGLDEVRKCYRLKRFGGRQGDDYLLVRIEPPLLGQRYGLGAVSIDRLILATRHEGESLFPVSEWPLYVHVARPLHDLQRQHQLGQNDIELIGWAEIYPTEDQARSQSL